MLQRDRLRDDRVVHLRLHARPRPAPLSVRRVRVRVADEVRVLLLVLDGEVRELDVEVLVDGVERAAQLQIVLQLNDHLLTDERFEKLKEVLNRAAATGSSAERQGERTN